MIKDSALVSLHRRPGAAVAGPACRARQNFRALETLAARSPRLLDPDDRLLDRPGPAREAHGRERPATVRTLAMTSRSAIPFASSAARSRPPGAEPIVRLEGLEKYFGSNHVLRGVHPRGLPARDDLPHRPVRIRQEHAPALHQLPRGADRRDDRGRRTPRRGRSAARAEPRAPSRRSARSACRPRWSSRSSTCSRT